MGAWYTISTKSNRTMGKMFPISTHMYLKYGVKRNPDAPRTMRNIMMSTAAAGDSLHAVEWSLHFNTRPLAGCLVPAVLKCLAELDQSSAIHHHCDEISQNEYEISSSKIFILNSLFPRRDILKDLPCF